MFSLNRDFNLDLSIKTNSFVIFCMIFVFHDVNIKISQNEDWTFFWQMLNYVLKIDKKMETLNMNEFHKQIQYVFFLYTKIKVCRMNFEP